MDCPICEANSLPQEKTGDNVGVFCPRCGNFRMSCTAHALLRANWPQKDRRRAALSAHVRQSIEQGSEVVELNDFELFDRLADAHRHTSVSTKLRRVMERYEAETAEPGQYVELTLDSDYPLFDAASVDEVQYLIATLHDGALLEYRPHPAGYRITSTGWEFLQPVGGGVPNAAFVAMSYDDSLKPAFLEGIRPAIIAAGFDDVRLDYVEHSDNIHDRIMADIRRAQFVVADFTGHRAGVYFEAGFALGLGKPVIWTCRADYFEREKVHFDTRPYNYIVWRETEELRSRLATRIAAVIPSARRS
jgi:hypothetical protein